MPALARAMYIFFLRHEEGVEFKQLEDFECEIFAIYRLASNRNNETKLKATVAQLVDPTENKVNECASRIKEAFLRIMDDYQAKNYYLTQKYVKYKLNNPFKKDRVDYFKDILKRVTLPRTLVEYPQCLIDLPKDIPTNHEEHIRQDQEYHCRVDLMNHLMQYMPKDSKTDVPQKLYDAVQAVLDMDPYNYRAHFNMGIICIKRKQYARAIEENTIVIEHDNYLWNHAYINRAEAYLFMEEYDRGLADIESYFNSVRRDKDSDSEAKRIRKLLEKKRHK